MDKGLLLDPRSGKIQKPVMAEIIHYDREAFLEQMEERVRKSREFPDIKMYSRNKHYIGVRPAAATAATARAVACNAWNPHASSRIQLWELWVANTAAVAFNVSLARTTARGTASTSAAMAAANSISNDTAAPSGVVIDTAWSVAATVSAADLIRWNIPATIGAGIILPFPDPIDITPASGMALITPTALAFQIADITWVIGD